MFKSSNAVFKDKNCFVDDMKRFVCDEAARFTTSGNEAASASIDEAFERGVRFSVEKNKRAIKAQKQVIKELNTEKKELLKTDIESIHPSEGEGGSTDSSSSSNTSEKDSKEKKESSSNQRSEKEKEIDSKKEAAKKEKSKEAKKAGAKVAVANLLKAKAEMSNDLSGEKVTGDAMKDGNTGMMKILTYYLNPMTYMRKLVAYLGAVIAPYILAFMAIAAVVMIIVMFIFSILQPLQEIGNAITNFLSMFTATEEYVDEGMSQTKIDEILAGISADDTQKAAVSYALSKVGCDYDPYDRMSGTSFDCSSLAYYAWEAAGVDISFGMGYPPSAAEEAKMLEQYGYSIGTMDLQPGDLVFYGGNGNGRYMGIYHVAIYVGNGMAVEALNESSGVVYQRLRTQNAIMVCRPNG